MSQLLFLAFRANVGSHLARPGDLFLSVLGSLINNFLYVYGIYLIAKISLFGHFNNVNIFLISTGLVTSAWGILNLLFAGLLELGAYIESGKLESFLATPRNPLLLIAISKCNISSIAELIQGLSVIIYIGIYFGDIYIVKMLIGTLITTIALLAVVIIGGSLSIFSRRGNSLSALFIQTVLSMSLFPMSSVLRGNEKWVLYFSPLLFSSFLPTQFIANGGWLIFFLGSIGSILFLACAIFLFNFCVKSYKTANYIRLSR